MPPLPPSHEPTGNSAALSNGLPSSSAARRVQRIAHRGGNTRAGIKSAINAGVDWIEIDVWYQYGRIVARHERAIWRLPIVYDSWTLRTHFRPLYLKEILDLAAGGPKLFLDFKGKHPPLASAVAGILRTRGAVDKAGVCGQFWKPLDELQRIAPDLASFYSLGRQEHITQLTARLEAGLRPAGVSIAHWLFTPEIARQLTAFGLEIFVWTVNDPAAA